MAELEKRNVAGANIEFEALQTKWTTLEKSFKAVQPKKKTKTPDTSESCPPIIKPKPISPLKKETIVLSPEFVMKVNKLREQVATISRALGSSEDVNKVKDDLDKISPKILELEEMHEGGIRGTPEQITQGKRVLQKLLDEWATVNITISQLMMRAPSSKSPSPSPVISPQSQASDITELESWLEEMEGKMKVWKESEMSSEESRVRLKEMEAHISKRHRYVSHSLSVAKKYYRLLTTLLTKMANFILQINLQKCYAVNEQKVTNESSI